MRVLAGCVAGVEHHVLVRVEIEIASGADLKITFNDQTAVSRVIENKLARLRIDQRTRRNQQLAGQLDPVDQISQQSPAHTDRQHRDVHQP